MTLICPHCKQDIDDRLIYEHTGKRLGLMNKGKSSEARKIASRLNATRPRPNRRKKQLINQDPDNGTKGDI